MNDSSFSLLNLNSLNKSMKGNQRLKQNENERKSNHKVLMVNQTMNNNKSEKIIKTKQKYRLKKK